MAIEYTGLAHVAFFAKDFDKMVDFYVQKLGGKYAYHLTRITWPEGRPFWPEGTQADDVWLAYICFGNQFIELFNESYYGDNAFNSHAFCCLTLEVGNLICMIEQLKKAGVKVCDAPEGNELTKSIIEYPLTKCNTRCAYVQDPEGNWVELMQFVPSSMQLTCK